MSLGYGDPSTAPSRVHVSRLGPAFDLLASYDPAAGFFFEREGLGVAASFGHGTPVSGADVRTVGTSTLERLRTLGIPDTGAPPPVAVGALPFGPSPGALWIPARTVRRTEEGETWLVDVVAPQGDAPAFAPERVQPDLPHDAFRPVQLREVPSPSAYVAAVAEGVRRIRNGDLSKVVLARTLEVDAGRHLDAKQLLHRLRAAEPHGYAFAAHAGDGVTLAGASPELLLSRRGVHVRSTPLAGSAPRSGDPDEDRANAVDLEASAKNREEHAIVVDAVTEVLGRFCAELTHDPQPVLLPTANVWHLATRFHGTLTDPGVTAMDLVAELHPTPAVCGTPTIAARAIISELEPFDRGCYAGPVGWMDANGDGAWAIALRCAALKGERATLFAGAGIVADSVPEQETDETDRKFRAFLDSLRWG